MKNPCENKISAAIAGKLLLHELAIHFRRSCNFSYSNFQREDASEYSDGSVMNMILVIDDDFFNREILKNIFSSNHDIIEAENGKIGLQMAMEYGERISAIFLDVIMPEMDGIDVLRIFEKNGITKRPYEKKSVKNQPTVV